VCVQDIQACAFYEAVAWCRIKEAEEDRVCSTRNVRVMVGNIEGERLLGGLGVDGRIVLR
jgi:hypothetical protein